MSCLARNSLWATICKWWTKSRFSSPGTLRWSSGVGKEFRQTKLSFQCGSDLLYQRYGMFALCILKPVVADTINDKFCPCKVFKKLSWNKLGAVKSTLLCMHCHLLHTVTYWRLKSKDNFQNMYLYWSVLVTVWYKCRLFVPLDGCA